MANIPSTAKIVRPQEGFQELFTRSSIDVVFGGGVLNCGKSFAAILSVAEPALESNFRACFTRRTFGELKMGGGLVDDFNVAFGKSIEIKNTEPPRITFKSGAFVEMRQINDENIKKITEHFKGLQADLIYMDELTSYQFSTFKYLLTRNRGKAKWTGKFRGTTNPKRNTWVREFIEWYIGSDGQIMPERNGVVRYFYMGGDTIKDVVWGNTKEEVYHKCKIDIDRKLKSLGGDFTYENMIKSFTFYLGKMSENKASIGTNMDYVGSVAAVGGAAAQQLIEGNWFADEEEDLEAPIPAYIAREAFAIDPQVNGDKWITADLADYGTDNFVVLVWDGLHIIDMLMLGNTTPARNALELQMMASKHGIPDSHIIFDGTNGRYILDYIPDAIPFISALPPVGIYARSACNRKDEAYLRLKYLLNNRKVSWDPKIGKTRYTHQKLNIEIFVETEFVEECSVVRFIQQPSGKRRLANKKDMNQMLGKGRSMDILDAVAMRLFPLAEYEYGTELEKTAIDNVEVKEHDSEIYKDSFWA